MSLPMLKKLGGETGQVRVETSLSPMPDLLDGPPANIGELPRVRLQLVVFRALEHVPKTHVGVACRYAFGDGGRDEQRNSLKTSNERWRDGKLLAYLSFSCSGRILTWIDVTTGCQPQTRIPVVDEQHRSSHDVDEHAIRHEMLRRCCRLGCPVQRFARCDPRHCIVVVHLLEIVERLDCANHLLKSFGHRYIMVDVASVQSTTLRSLCSPWRWELGPVDSVSI